MDPTISMTDAFDFMFGVYGLLPVARALSACQVCTAADFQVSQ